MNRNLCLVICFIIGVILFYLLKQSCGCSEVEGMWAWLNNAASGGMTATPN